MVLLTRTALNWIVSILIAFITLPGARPESIIRGCRRSFFPKASAPSFLSKDPSYHCHCSFTSTKRGALNSILSLRGGDTDRIQTITSLSQIQTILTDASQNNHLVVLDFAANNCPPCEMIKPIYTDLSQLEEFANAIFCKVNVSDYPEVAKEYGVDGWPTFLLFKDGKVVDSVVGGQAAKAGLYGLVAKNMQ